jgi:hypothetical protein
VGVAYDRRHLPAHPEANPVMEVRIGVVHTPKELSFETDAGADDVVSQVEAALKQDDAFVWLEDGKGRKIGVPADKIAYVEVVVDDGSRKVGFGR